MTREEERKEAAKTYGITNPVCEIDEYGNFNERDIETPAINFEEGAEWADSHAWKDAQGDDLPEIDREVIVLVEEYGHYKVCFAHRPVESYTGVSITNHSEMEEYYPERYDKGGWNIPDVKYWLDLDIPKQ